MSPKKFLVGLTLCLLLGIPAHAKVRLAVINTGDELFEVAAFPSAVIEQYPAAKDLMAGYKCSHFGIFWADVWTWDCTLVAVSGTDSYSDLPADVTSQLSADPRYLFKKAKRGFWNHYAFWTFLMGALAIYLLTRDKGERRRPAGQYA